MCTSMHMYKYIFTKLKEGQNTMDLGGPFTALGKVRAQQQWLNLFGPLLCFLPAKPDLRKQGKREDPHVHLQLLPLSGGGGSLHLLRSTWETDDLTQKLCPLTVSPPKALWCLLLQLSCNSPATLHKMALLLSQLAAFRGILGLPWPWTPAGLASPSVPSVRQF